MTLSRLTGMYPVTRRTPSRRGDLGLWGARPKPECANQFRVRVNTEWWNALYGWHPMIPDAFASKYPNLASMLMAIRSQEPANSCAVGTVGSTEIGELSALINDEEPLVGLLDAVFDGQPQPDDEFMRFSVTGFVRLGASEEARIFIGRLWADAIQGWDSAGRRDFLRLLLRDPHEVFAALEVATELFRRVQFTVDEIFPWILEAHALIANDAYQEGFWRCVEALSTTSPQAATSLAGRCLDSGPQGHTVVSNIDRKST